MKQIKYILLSISIFSFVVFQGYAADIEARSPQFSVVIDKQNGEVIKSQIDSGTVFNQQQYLLPVPIKDNFIFEGWDCNLNINEPIKNDLLITAKWISVADYQKRQDSILWAQKIRPQVEDLFRKETSVWHKQILILIIIAGLSLLIAVIAIYLHLKLKKKFSVNLWRELQNSKDKGELDKFLRPLLEKIPINVDSRSSGLPERIDEQQFKQLFEKHYTSKQQNDDNRRPREKELIETQQHNSIKVLYADTIIDGKFNTVKDIADNSETIFELRLSGPDESRAKILIYKGAYPRILANPSFLEGCERQLIGNNYTQVQTTIEGDALKLSDGKCQVINKPEVKLS